jgi:hypothetical protein
MMHERERTRARSAFLQVIAARLAATSDPGDGDVDRAIGVS